MADIGGKLEMDQKTIAKLRSGQKFWAASHDDGSKNRINEDAVLEAASCDLSLGILTALFMWVRKKFRNRGKTKGELTAEKEAAKINRSCRALDVMLLEYVQSAQKGMIDEETLDDLIRTLEEMHGYDQAGKMIIPDREVLIEIRDAIVKYTSLITDGRVVRLVLPSETTGDFNIIRDQLMRQRELIRKL